MQTVTHNDALSRFGCALWDPTRAEILCHLAGLLSSLRDRRLPLMSAANTAPTPSLRRDALIIAGIAVREGVNARRGDPCC